MKQVCKIHDKAFYLKAVQLSNGITNVSEPAKEFEIIVL